MTVSSEALHIMVVDDHELTRCALMHALLRQGFISKVQVATHGRDAIAQLGQMPPEHHPDLILMDLHMPIMDGWAASTWIKKHYPYIKIVAYSAAEGGCRQAKQHGATIDAFCDKGECTQSLLQTIQQVL